VVCFVVDIDKIAVVDCDYGADESAVVVVVVEVELIVDCSFGAVHTITNCAVVTVSASIRNLCYYC
jgi:hypothetical protein